MFTNSVIFLAYKKELLKFKNKWVFKKKLKLITMVYLVLKCIIKKHEVKHIEIGRENACLHPLWLFRQHQFEYFAIEDYFY